MERNRLSSLLPSYPSGVVLVCQVFFSTGRSVHTTWLLVVSADSPCAPVLKLLNIIVSSRVSEIGVFLSFRHGVVVAITSIMPSVSSLLPGDTCIHPYLSRVS